MNAVTIPEILGPFSINGFGPYKKNQATNESSFWYVTNEDNDFNNCLLASHTNSPLIFDEHTVDRIITRLNSIEYLNQNKNEPVESVTVDSDERIDYKDTPDNES